MKYPDVPFCSKPFFLSNRLKYLPSLSGKRPCRSPQSLLGYHSPPCGNRDYKLLASQFSETGRERDQMAVLRKKIKDTFQICPTDALEMQGPKERLRWEQEKCSPHKTVNCVTFVPAFPICRFAFRIPSARDQT